MTAPTILVLEDEWGVAETIREHLSARGREVVHCRTGAEALNWARNRRPDLALIDLNLPDLSGRKVIETLKAEGIDFPFICISGAGDASVVIEMMKLGATDYIQKGVEFFTLLTPVVEQTLGRIERERRLEESERERRELEEKVRQAEKLESLTVLARGIAHDFNNLLSSIIGYTRLAMSDLPPETLIYANLQEVYQAGARAKELVEQIVNFSRGADADKVPLDLARATREILEGFKTKLPDNVQVEEDLPTSPAPLLANPVQIRRLVEALLENARLAMTGEGGILRVRVESNRPLNRRLSSFPVVSESSRFAVLTVEDSGIGMSPEIQARAFEPFFTTRGLEGARGMGLSAAHGIVRGLGGGIDIESAPGRGTILRVYFPQPSEADRTSIALNETVAGGNERILIVDDEKSIASLARQVLERLGYRVTVAHDGFEALEVVRKEGVEFDLVLTDLIMPQMSGSDLAKSIRSMRPDLPILVLTGSTQSVDERDFENQGIVGCLPKPLTPAELGRYIRQALDGAVSGS